MSVEFRIFAWDVIYIVPEFLYSMAFLSGIVGCSPKISILEGIFALGGNFFGLVFKLNLGLWEEALSEDR